MTEFNGDDLSSLNSRININRFESSKILITGASGMLGSYLANSINGLLELNGKRPAKMLLTSRNGDFSNIVTPNSKNLSFYSGHFRDFSLEDGFEYIFHAASPASPTQYSDISSVLDANILPLKEIAKSQSELQELFFISAGETYGFAFSDLKSTDLGLFDDIPKSRTHYPLAKLASEEAVRDLSNELDCEYRIIKLFHCFGPGVREHDGRSFADFIWAAARGNFPMLKSAGTDIRTFLYLEDVIAGLLIKNGTGRNLEYNLGGSKAISIFDFAKKVMQIAGIAGDPLRIHQGDSYIESPFKSIIPNCDWLKSEGWVESVSLDDAIFRTLKSVQASDKF